MRDVMISLCDKSGVMAAPWARAGYVCYCVDVQHKVRSQRVVDIAPKAAGGRPGKIIYTWGDVRTWVPPEAVARRVAFFAAFPPCTHVAVSGARDFRTKGTALLRDSLELFSACYSAARWSGASFLLENPVGKFSDHMLGPDYTFHPWHYGDLWTKLTCLWTGGGFKMPPPLHLEQPAGVEQLIWKMPPGKDRADARSQTPPNFARCVFEANCAEVF